MTYYNYTSSYYTNYEFTAFAESDLVSGNLGCGSTFKMPACASVCITVKDNDKSLSGDGGGCWGDDKASDSSGQTAKIDMGGNEVGNGGQIYAESYFWVKDQYGNWYVMIEIEQEGSGKDFFTFYTGDGYKMPPAGARLTVYSECDISGDWLKYSDMGAGKCSPATGDISGTVFCDTNCDGINGISTVIPGCDYKIEAEKMYDCGFQTFYSSTASGGKAVRLNCAGGYGELATCFSGKTGTYDVAIRVQDENDGRSTIKLLVGGQYVEAVRLDKDTDGSGNDNGAYSTYVIKNVAIKDGQTIKLAVWGNGGEYVRIDKIDLKGQDKVVLTDEPTKAGVTVKLVALDGTVVAETTTDANGNYKFDDVPVGQYKVMGVAPDGTHFTIKDAQGNTKDAIDSDVGHDGMSDVITVTKDSKTDIDLGLCKEELGSLSGRYFCDTDNDDQDNGNGNEPPVAGVKVTLLDAAGNPTGATTFTDANGNYQFTNLAAGVYGVLFTDPNGVLVGKTLITANVGNDASDSDAIGDIVSSTITGITVVAGADTPDNDAGVEKLNETPVAADDAGKACADETIAVNLLANDSDPDGDVLSVVSISDGDETAGVGGSITLAGGAIATLNADGTVTVDGTAAYAGLLIGEKAYDMFSYTVTDGTATAMADVDLSFCGAKNTLETIAAGPNLPSTLSFRLDTLAETPLSQGFTLTTSSASAVFDGTVFAEAYCLDRTDAIVDGVYVEANVYVGTAALAAGSSLSATGLANLDLITWVLNQDFGSIGNGEGGFYTETEIQGAIWGLVGNTPFVPPGTGTLANVNEILNFAFNDVNRDGIADGGAEGFEAGEGDIVALILDPVIPSATGHVQPFVIGVAFDDLAQDCLCRADHFEFAA